MKKINKKRFTALVKAVIVTMLTMGFSHVISSCLSIDLFSKLNNERDFITSDIAKAFAYTKDTELDNDILIVSIDNYSWRRDSLAMVIKNLREAEPCIIALDVLFKVESIYDSILIDEISKCENIVIAADSEYNRNFSFYNKMDEKTRSRLRVTNLIKNRTNGTCRTFEEYYENDTTLTFATEVAKMFESSTIEELETSLNKHDRKDEEINFSRRFKTINCEEIEKYKDLINGKIVFVGALNDAGDIHTTPVNPKMPGIEIHAYSASTIINTVYFKKQSTTWRRIIAFVLCCMIVYFRYRTVQKDERKAAIVNFAWRIFTLFSIFFVALALIYFFVVFNYSLEVGTLMLMLASYEVFIDAVEFVCSFFIKNDINK